MNQIIKRSITVLVLAVLVIWPVLAQDTTAITLKPFTNDAYGISGVQPDGWTDAGGGALVRRQTPADVTLVLQQSTPLAPDKFLQAILPQLQLTAAPDSVGIYQTDVLDWTLYKVDVKVNTATISVDLALAALDGKTYVVTMQTDSSEYDALHKAVFVPMLDAFKLLIAEPTEPVPYTQEEVTFANGDISLAGTLTLPEGDGPFPAMVLVTGSGPQDRDESLAPVAAIKPFALIADALTRKGVAVLRYDDRGVGKSTGDFGSATTADFATDASAAIDFLLTRDDINHDQIGLLGHSEGGDVAAMLGASNPHLAFIVSMAGPAVSGADILVKQNERILRAAGSNEDTIRLQLEFLPKMFVLVKANDAEGMRKLTHELVLAQAKFATADQLKAIGDVEAYAQRQADAIVMTYNTDWFRFFLDYNPGEDWAKTKIPVLAIYGVLDVQVDADQNEPAFEAAMKKAGNPDYQVVTLPKANHLMQEATTGSPAEYGTLKQEFSPDFLPTVTDWVLKHVTVNATS